MKAILSASLSGLMIIASQFAVADSGNHIFRTDRIMMVKPAKVEMPTEVTSQISPQDMQQAREYIQRTDRISFYKMDVAEQQQVERERIRRSDRIVFDK